MSRSMTPRQTRERGASLSCTLSIARPCLHSTWCVSLDDVYFKVWNRQVLLTDGVVWLGEATVSLGDASRPYVGTGENNQDH